MALTPDTDQFSQFLRLAFLRSPNFVSGVSGWTINQDGSVEFNNGTFRGVIEGGRLLIYNGTPSAGNLIGSVSGTNTPDRFGNAVDIGICSYNTTFGNTGQLNGASLSLFGGVNLLVQLTPSGLTIFNSHGATIFSLDETRDAFFLYADTSSASQGALLASIAAGNGTDAFSNHFLGGGYVFYSTGIAVLFAGTAGMQAFSGSLAAGWTATGANIAPAANATEWAVFKPLQLVDESAPSALATGPQLFGSTNSGMLRYVSDSGSGDSQQYDTGSGRAYVTGAPVTVNSLSQTAVAGMARSLAVGIYVIRGMIFGTQGAAGPGQQAMGFSASGGLAASAMDILVTGWVTTTGAGAALAPFEATSLGSRGGFGAPPLNDTFVLQWEGTITVTTAGTLNVAVSCVTSATDTWQVRALSFLEVCPVG